MERTAERTDQMLVHAAKAGDLDAFEELVNRHERRIYTLARRITANEQDAEDVTQEAFLSAVEHLAGFREESSFGTWLSRIATHAALKIIRKRKGLPTEPLEQQDDLPRPAIHCRLARITRTTRPAQRNRPPDR